MFIALYLVKVSSAKCMFYFLLVEEETHPPLPSQRPCSHRHVAVLPSAHFPVSLLGVWTSI